MHTPCPSCANNAWMSLGYLSEQHCCFLVCGGQQCIEGTAQPTTPCNPFSGSTFMQNINGQCACPCCPCPPHNESCSTSNAGCAQASILSGLPGLTGTTSFTWDVSNCSYCVNNSLSSQKSGSFFVLYGAGKTCIEILNGYQYVGEMMMGEGSSCNSELAMGTDIWAYSGEGIYSIAMFVDCSGNCSCGSEGFISVIEFAV